MTYIKLQTLIVRDEAQDVVEYALVVALLAFGAVSTMSSLSNEIGATFNTISTKLSTSL